MAIKQFERSGAIDSGCNASFITLVPKIANPISLNDFRPISLIGSLYKIIAKILAERLKSVISHVISPVQTAFIRGRSILDGPLIVNEVLSWLKKHKKKAFILKVDFEKAFDSLNWSYLDSVLEQMNFGQIWRSWIQGCLKSAMISVLVNGSPTTQFRMERGVRQGDPLAPFLFIIAAEGLHRAIETAKEQNLFSGIQLSNGGPVISHLQYADDAIFCGDWSIQNARNLIRILKCFELATGLKVNLNKSKLFGISTVPAENETIARIINCPVGSFPFLYLGLPIGVPMGRAAFWNPLIEKFRARLSRWKAASLSFGGRLTLCKSVLGGLGTYYFSLYKAPDKVIDELERIRMRFFWGNNENRRKIVWIAWKKVISSKENGGLGIGSLKAQNTALLGKWWWKFWDSSRCLWKDVVKAIHGADGLLGVLSKPRSGCWGAIASLASCLTKNNIHFSQLFELATNESGAQNIIWKLDRSNGYSASSFSKFFDSSVLLCRSTQWEWNKLVPRKVNILAWRVINGKLPTLENLNKVGVRVQSNCRICGFGPENEDHIFTRCPLAKEVWTELQNWWFCLGLIPSNCLDLLNNKKEFIGPGWLAEVNEAVILIFIWVLWTFRNKGIFRGDVKSQLELVTEIQILSHLWINARRTTGVRLNWAEWTTNPVALFSC